MPTISHHRSMLNQAEQLPPVEVIFGRSEAMRILRRKVVKIADADLPLLIYGESGTGKEVLARLIHSWSSRRFAPFVKVNCPAIPGTLLESELFGYERGAFTGAHATKPGRVELANRGTLFLDEISEIDSSLQAKLLQFLQDGQFCRLGGEEDRRADVRAICATNREFEGEVEGGALRQDLLHRISVIAVRMPPLRERRRDLPVLANHLVASCNERFNRRAQPLSSPLMRSLAEYDWPGNIRELENLIKRYVVLGTEDCIAGELRGRRLTPSARRSAPPECVTLRGLARTAMREAEHKVIIEALENHHWNRKEAARSLNISYRALLYKLRQASSPIKGS